MYVRCYVFSKMELTVVGNSEGKPDATFSFADDDFMAGSSSLMNF